MPFVRIDLFEGRTLEQKKASSKGKQPKLWFVTLVHHNLLFMSSSTICLKELTSRKEMRTKWLKQSA